MLWLKQLFAAILEFFSAEIKKDTKASNADTTPKKYGIVTTVNHVDKQISVAAPLIATLNVGSYMFFSKDNRVNTSGLTGYYATAEYRNYSKLPAEMFATSVNYVESSK